MDGWVESENIWLARVAILHQERYRERTDSEMLFAYCLRRAADREFFVRKAIGWALRSYAKVEPDLVAQFLTGHGAALSGLSRRDAERGVAMGARPRDQRASWRAAGDSRRTRSGPSTALYNFYIRPRCIMDRCNAHRLSWRASAASRNRRS